MHSHWYTPAQIRDLGIQTIEQYGSKTTGEEQLVQRFYFDERGHCIRVDRMSVDGVREHERWYYNQNDSLTNYVQWYAETGEVLEMVDGRPMGIWLDSTVFNYDDQANLVEMRDYRTNYTETKEPQLAEHRIYRHGTNNDYAVEEMVLNPRSFFGFKAPLCPDSVVYDTTDLQRPRGCRKKEVWRYCRESSEAPACTETFTYDPSTNTLTQYPGTNTSGMVLNVSRFDQRHRIIESTTPAHGSIPSRSTHWKYNDHNQVVARKRYKDGKLRYSMRSTFNHHGHLLKTERLNEKQEITSTLTRTLDTTGQLILEEDFESNLHGVSTTWHYVFKYSYW